MSLGDLNKPCLWHHRNSQHLSWQYLNNLVSESLAPIARVNGFISSMRQFAVLLDYSVLGTEISTMDS